MDRLDSLKSALGFYEDTEFARLRRILLPPQP
jgi:hypothetical protein